METLLKAKQKGLRVPLEQFSQKLLAHRLREDTAAQFAGVLAEEMTRLDFDEVIQDKAGTIIGVINGYGAEEDLVLISHMDFPDAFTKKKDADEMVLFKGGILSSIYAAGLLKRCSLALKGNLIVACVPRTECGDFGIRYLFENYLASRRAHIKGVILCEPTGLDVYLGHKGRFEYEIMVRGTITNNFLASRGVNILGTMFPLIHELEKVSRELPRDCELGDSSLEIKDVAYNSGTPAQNYREFKVVVDRAFVPEENPTAILKRAQAIGKTVYQGEPLIEVQSALTKSTVKSYTGLEVVAAKELKPWKMESHQPLVVETLQTLREADFNAQVGYWKKVVTEGSYTYGELKIPTIGFGAGYEEMIDSAASTVHLNDIEKAVYGTALIAHRAIGIPAFGWSPEEI